MREKVAYICLLVLCTTCLAVNAQRRRAKYVDGASRVKPVGRTNESESGAMQYFGKFGYVEEAEARAGLNPERLIQVIKLFQKFFGLRQTGKLDSETLAEMKKDRCGVKDLNSDQRHSRRKRYELQGSKWNKTELTWRVSKYSQKLDQRATDSAFKRAFDAWEKETVLRFIHSPQAREVDIDIQFGRRDHGDHSPFDGPGTTLAHAFYPQFGGDAHFDDDEKWTIDSDSGIDLLSVAVHEFGHSLGLRHSNKREALMFPTYAGKRYDLRQDDVQGIKAIYGDRRGGGGRESGGRDRPTRRPRFHIPFFPFGSSNDNEGDKRNSERGNREQSNNDDRRPGREHTRPDQENRPNNRENPNANRENRESEVENRYPNRGNRDQSNNERRPDHRENEVGRYPNDDRRPGRENNRPGSENRQPHRERPDSNRESDRENRYPSRDRENRQPSRDSVNRENRSESRPSSDPYGRDRNDRRENSAGYNPGRTENSESSRGDRDRETTRRYETSTRRSRFSLFG